MRLISYTLQLFSFYVLSVSSLSANNNNNRQMTRRALYQKALSLGFFAGSLTLDPVSAFANFDTMSSSQGPTIGTNGPPPGAVSQVVYKTLSLPLEEFGVNVPVACWFPDDGSTSMQAINNPSGVKYDHRISVKRIGQLLAGWDFIPDFVSRNFAFSPSTSIGSVMDGGDIPFPTSSKVVFLAHGYLGSRFDLSHLAEELAQQGFVCISPEYPESLAASYPRFEGLDRSKINDKLLQYVQENLRPRSYAGIGHSLGCGTVLRMGDNSWTRVLIAGRAPEASSSPLLFISSTNDGAVRFGGPLTVPAGYELLQESNLPLSNFPTRAALIFDRPDAPNHISYLSENVNEAMVGFLSPLLPIAQAMSIPVLDFDRYQQSRDSVQTAAILKPVIAGFLSQQMSNVDTTN
jgi:hypothetical protein